jgi:polysaccharide export outer membrane protein
LGAVLAGCAGIQADPYQFNPLAETNQPAANQELVGTNMSPADLGAYVIAVGDDLTVNFNDVNPAIQPITDTIKDDGKITLIYNQSFVAVGKTIAQLQEDIRNAYVPAYFRYLSVNVRPQSRFFTVSGEVRVPNRYVYTGRTTVNGAIATAGGFTDFSNKKSVSITRAGGKQQLKENCVKALREPSLDIEVYPGDLIHVKKRFW